MSKFDKKIKKIFHFIAYFFIFPIVILINLLNKFGQNSIFIFFNSIMSLFPGYFGNLLRVAYYSKILKKMTPHVYIGFGTLINSRNSQIGENVFIGAYCILGDVKIMDNVMIASRVQISNISEMNLVDVTNNIASSELKGSIQIGSNSWIGEGAIVLENVANNCIVGSGCVVDQPINENLVVAGNPARIIQGLN